MIKSAAPLAPQVGLRCRSRKCDLGLHPALMPGRYSTIHCGIDAKTWDAALDEILQEIAVVAGNLDHARGGPKRKPLRGAPYKTAGVSKPRIRKRRKIHVVAMEMRVRGFIIFELDEPTDTADICFQRIIFFAQRHPFPPNKGVRDWRQTKIDQDGLQRSTA